LATTIFPSTAGDVKTQYLKLGLKINFPNTNSHKEMTFEFFHSRGLSDQRLLEIREIVENRIKEDEGEGILFEIIDLIKDNLTTNNVPSDHCPICLVNFHQADKLLKTSCYHHFHLYCFKNYINIALKDQTEEVVDEEVPCPKCRQKIQINSDEIQQEVNEPYDDDVVEFDCQKFHEKNKKLKRIYEKQKRRGGIIPEVKNEFVLNLSLRR